jgi:hypothetical protein
MPNVMGSVLVGKRQLVFTTSCILNDAIFRHLVLISETNFPILPIQDVECRRTLNCLEGREISFLVILCIIFKQFPRVACQGDCAQSV